MLSTHLPPWLEIDSQPLSLWGWRNTRLAQKNNSTTLLIVTVLHAWWTAEKPFSLTCQCKTLINCKKASFFWVRAFIVRETRCDSRMILRKKTYLSCTLHALPFVICTQHILSYENRTVRAFIVRETQCESRMILRKKTYLSCTLHALPFVICTQHILSYENRTVFVLCSKPSKLDILRKFNFLREDRTTK